MLLPAIFIKGLLDSIKLCELINELTKSLYLGARYFVDKNMYVGGKGTYTIIDGPEDKLGIKYDDITQYGVVLSVGYQF